MTPDDRQFQADILDYWRRHGRSLPWRDTADPYRIFVSEIMLQQTQASRVVPKYLTFIEHFAGFAQLAAASFPTVLRLWQGLGYNRRARNLHAAAAEITRSHGGELPDDLTALIALPGVGANTAGALLAFAFNRPVVFVETNIRRVFLHRFFPSGEGVHDQQILQLIERTLDRKQPRIWYWALMDYGAMLAREIANPNRRSAHYSRQSRFANSNRQVRGAILRALLDRQRIATERLPDHIGFENGKVETALEQLEREGFVVREGSNLSLSENGLDGSR